MRQVYIVIGHLRPQLPDYIGDGSRWNLKIEYIEQRHPLGTAHAALQLEELIHDPFVLILGDVYFELGDPKALVEPLETGAAAGVLAAKYEEDSEALGRNFCILLNDNEESVRKVVEKPLYATSTLKGCGIYAFQPSVFDAIRKTPRTALRDEYEITHSIQLFIDDGNRVVAPTVVRQDVNLTFPVDVLQCNMLYLDDVGRRTLVDPAARVEEGAELDEVVVGPGAIVQTGAKLKRSVVFPDSRVGRIEACESLITPGAVVRCRPDRKQPGAG